MDTRSIKLNLFEFKFPQAKRGIALQIHSYFSKI